MDERVPRRAAWCVRAYARQSAARRRARWRRRTRTRTLRLSLASEAARHRAAMAYVVRRLADGCVPSRSRAPHTPPSSAPLTPLSRACFNPLTSQLGRVCVAIRPSNRRASGCGGTPRRWRHVATARRTRRAVAATASGARRAGCAELAAARICPLAVRWPGGCTPQWRCCSSRARPRPAPLTPHGPPALEIAALAAAPRLAPGARRFPRAVRACGVRGVLAARGRCACVAAARHCARPACGWLRGRSRSRSSSRGRCRCRQHGRAGGAVCRH